MIPPYPAFVLAEADIELPVQVFSMSLSRYPPRRKLCEAPVPPGGHRDGTDAVIRDAVPGPVIRPTAPGAATSAGTPSTPAGGRVRTVRPHRPWPAPSADLAGLEPALLPPIVQRVTARGPGTAPGRATIVRPRTRPRRTTTRGTRGRNPSSSSSRLTIPAVNPDARFGGRNPSRSRIAAIAFGASPRPCNSASPAARTGHDC